jgi:hypothetical protein
MSEEDDEDYEDNSTEYCIVEGRLSPNDYLEIKKIAIALHAQGEFERDQFKCTIEAFQLWARQLLDGAEENKGFTH